VLYSIKGAEAFNTQTVTEPVSADTVGVKALDDYTVEFELTSPAGYFPGIAGMWVARPVPKEVIEEHGDQWTEPGNIWTNGSYLLHSWAYYYGFNVTKAPVDNKNLRRALSYAVDRKTLCDAVLKGGQLPAQTFACPGIFGSPAEDPSFKGIAFDPAMAKKELELAGYPGGAGLPKITLMFNTSEGHQRIAQFVQANWKEHLGIDVELANQEWKVYIKTVNEDAPPIYRMGWCADYPDENNWVLEVFHSTKGTNAIKWSNSEFDQLTEQAAFESDPAKRKDLYFKAEQILCVDEAAIIPLYYYTRVVLTRGYITRTYAPLGGEHIDKWKIDRPQVPHHPSRLRGPPFGRRGHVTCFPIPVVP